ncbi:MAG: MFS transporter [Opitutales bacterium]
MKENQKNWLWIASVYFIQGLPNALCAALAQIYYISQGVALSTATLITSFIYLPWALKALWAPLVDMYSTKRRALILSGFFMSGVALLLGICSFSSSWVLISAIFFWALAFLSATYDISADGYYILALDKKDQAFFVGIRSAFYRLSLLFVQGFLVALAGILSIRFSSEKLAWGFVFALCALIFLSFTLFFKVFLPRKSTDIPTRQEATSSVSGNFFKVYIDFFSSKGFVNILIFLLFYRFAEAQLSKVAPAFLLADRADGGLGLSLTNQGFIYGTAGTICLFLGGILGGVLISRWGLLKCLIPFALAINVPNLVYLIMAYFPTDNFALISSLVSIEQFGYGLGFSAYMAFMLRAVQGKSKTSQYAILSSLMALSLMLGGFFTGFIQEALGYKDFFLWIMLSTLVSFASLVPAIKFLKTK